MIHMIRSRKYLGKSFPLDKNNHRLINRNDRLTDPSNFDRNWLRVADTIDLMGIVWDGVYLTAIYLLIDRYVRTLQHSFEQHTMSIFIV